MRGRRVLAVLGLVVVLAAGCREGAPAGAAPEPIRPAWRPVTLPVPPGAPGRLVLGDAAACAGRWFVVGAVADAAGGTRPAAWTSDDGLSWRTVSVAAASYYGRQDVLFAATCHGGRLAALGARAGGAHGNPRVSAWIRPDGGPLVEASSSGDLSGGVPDGDVARLAGGGPGGWLVVGGGEHAPGSWSSADGRRFRRHPAAAGDADVAGAAVYDVLAGAGDWWAVGSVTGRGRLDPVGSVWRSGDGRDWRRVALPSPDGAAELQRVAWAGGGPVAVGRSGDGFRAWRWSGGEWSAGARFGAADSAGAPVVRGFAAVGVELWAVVARGGGCRLWWSPDRGGSWREVVPPVSGGARAALAVQHGRLLAIFGGDGSVGAWITSLPVGAA
ncbi:hypothetical protein [Micromonospora eburnea]|uniref:BNR repeat-like domain-containing protein n=1 Tax=Micromonospora eburnea TaxID=227316 RepID=A0A1C6V540_9ACTN|nr:hypothetical protein [Micromonospora eburnea]SCL61479.1 hypothetical protein GA0070604_4522 [Micromonospora eburnea]